MGNEKARVMQRISIGHTAMPCVRGEGSAPVAEVAVEFVLGVLILFGPRGVRRSSNTCRAAFPVRRSCLHRARRGVGRSAAALPLRDVHSCSGWLGRQSACWNAHPPIWPRGIFIMAVGG